MNETKPYSEFKPLITKVIEAMAHVKALNDDYIEQMAIIQNCQESIVKDRINLKYSEHLKDLIKMVKLLEK